ncbi:MAG: hypothetical protein E7256_16700, partial [Lachnospiraceae bacterium]|nr:hypothetical protein [Lachnospiraceae bacterium]
MKKQCIKATEFERVGRTFVWRNIVWCGLSGTGIRFMTNAKKVSFHLIGDSSVHGQKTEGMARVSIFVDDKRQKDVMIEEPYVKVAVELDPTENQFHKVQLIKLSECAMSAFGIEEVVLESDLDVMVSKVVQKDKKIEFIGDSITCGYGVDMEDPATSFRTDTEDCTKAYAYKTAKLLDAEYSLVSFSGYGIITGYTETDEMRRDQIVSAYYEKCGFSYAHPVAQGEDGPAFESVVWNFGEYVPDVVVVNLGT